MSDILYSKLRLEVPSNLNGQNATISRVGGTAKTVVMTSPITDIMIPGMGKYRVQAGLTDTYITVSYGEIIKVKAIYFSTLENTSWADVAAIIKYGKFAQVASVGATKSFKINNKTYHAEVVHINSTSSSYYPANTVDFISKELYETNTVMNESYKNNGGFPKSQLINQLNNPETYSSSIFTLLPTELKNVIRGKYHIYEAGQYQSSRWSSSNAYITTKLWLPTYYEIFSESSSAIPDNSAYSSKYTLASLIKKVVGTSTARSWYLATPHGKNSGEFFGVGTDGNLAAINANGGGTVACFPICFRIG